MCDDEIHQGLIHDPDVTRRTFGLTAAATVALAAGSAYADAEVVETDVAVTTPDGAADAALFHPAGTGPWPAVLIWTDILGLRPVFRQMGRRLAAQGYVVLVPNPFYRVKRAPIVDASFDFSKPEDRAKVMPLAAALTPEGTVKDATAFIAFLDAQPQTKTAAKAGVQGYCMGGPLAFRTAGAVANRIGALATCHGGNLVTAKPDSPHLLIPAMKAKAFCAVADNDDKREPNTKETLKAAFAAAKDDAKIQVYEGANHGWCVKGNAVYNEAAAERAWSELSALYKSALV
ncbi:dienelactone hydrolase family protein [Beijerinckia sp. L45]|uniref:dienelactone hydrolase family protein n=1 Tax=Beijerinckia sp. L45 TaxID=1641855 RepID=UPI00131B8A46|nr:dienelactone hydrolase family protein [Beijerinckia sp. L45]